MWHWIIYRVSDDGVDMRVQARLALIEKEAESVLKLLGIKSVARHGGTIVHLYVDDVRYKKLMDEVRSRGLTFHEERNLMFEEREMKAGEFFQMVSRAQWGYPEPQDDYKSRIFDRSSACRICGTGAKQIHPFSVAGTPRFGRGDVVALFWVYEFLVTDHLKNIMEEANLTGMEFWPLMALSKQKQQRQLGGAWQLYITSELPPMSPRMRFPPVRLPRGAQPCECGRVGRNIPDEPLRYKRADLANAKDINKSNEWLGGGLDTTQLKTVSRRVYDLFVKHNIKGVDFEPIVVED